MFRFQLERCRRQEKSVRVNKRNEIFGDLRVQISIKKLPLRKAKVPSNLWLERYTILEGNPRFDRARFNMNQVRILQKHSLTVTSAWQNRQETDLKRFSGRWSPATVVRPANFCHDSCESGSARVSYFPLLALTVSFYHRFCSSSSRTINFSCSKQKTSWSLAVNTSAWSLSNEIEPFFLFEGFFALAKGQVLLHFFFNDME